MGFSMASVFFYGITRHIYNYIKLKQAAQKLLIEKQQAELNYLKSQTNPHFLFNKLNNIYSLARDKSDLAPESILRLSKILRFMLYETGGAYIAIEQELKIINDYIELEKLRYDDSLRVNFNHDIEDMKQALPPLLLIPLVENAFKHGMKEKSDRSWLKMSLDIKGNEVLFRVDNSFYEKVPSPGIGISSVKNILDLQYQGKHEIQMEHGENRFSVTLKLKLS